MAEKKGSSKSGKDNTGPTKSEAERTDAPAAKSAGEAKEPNVDLVSVVHDPRPGGTWPEGLIAGDTGAASTSEGPGPAEDVQEPDRDPGAHADTSAVPPPVPPAPVPEGRRGGGFTGGLFGGIIAAALGFGAAYLYFGEQFGTSGAQIQALDDRVAAQEEATGALQDELDAGPDLSAVTDRLDGFGNRLAGMDERLSGLDSGMSELSGRLDVVQGDIADLTDRVSELEKRPVTESVSPEAIQAYETELERLRQAMADQRAEVEALVEEARAVESETNETAAATLRRAALTRILSALDNGTPYASALADLQEAGQEVPEALAAAAETGVPSLAELRATFPEAAREALSAARAAEDGPPGSFGDFLWDQLGARSLEPKEGDSADAILSRAEGALRAGRLGDALAELDALPDVARAEMAGWVEDARIRQNAVSAAEDLSAALNAG